MIKKENLVKVIFCKNCKHHETIEGEESYYRCSLHGGMIVSNDFFCKDSESVGVNEKEEN